MEDTRKVAFIAVPSPPGELRSLFTSAEGSIRRLLECPPALRANGWDLQTGERAQTVRGEMARVAIGDRKVAELYRDGTFIFACRADDWFLAWASPNGSQRLNPLALVEVAYSFAAFYSSVVSDLETPPREVHFRIDLRNMLSREPKATLAPYGLGSAADVFQMDVHEAPENDATLREIVTEPRYEAAVVAYQLVREIYVWFGLEEEHIPYAVRREGVPKLDIAAIIHAGQ